MNRYRLVIFDLDGTLLYTVPDIAEATNHALSACGYPIHSETSIAGFIGNGINKLFERALPEHARNQEEVLRIRSLFLPYYNEHCADKTRPFGGIPELLREIQAAGIMIAVASNKYHPATAKLVPHFFPDIRFSAIFGEREGVPRKPDPSIVFDILSVSGLHCDDRKTVLYVGDSGVDMQTAANARIEAVGVTWGCRSREELATFAPAHIVDKPEEILAIVRLSRKC